MLLPKSGMRNKGVRIYPRRPMNGAFSDHSLYCNFWCAGCLPTRRQHALRKCKHQSPYQKHSEHLNKQFAQPHTLFHHAFPHPFSTPLHTFSFRSAGRPERWPRRQRCGPCDSYGKLLLGPPTTFQAYSILNQRINSGTQPPSTATMTILTSGRK